MKLRISSNSVRLRLSPEEVKRLALSGYIEEYTEFGNMPFVYALQCKHSGNELTADFDGGKITIFIPADFAAAWTTSDTNAISNNMHVTDSESLSLLVEKDLKP